MSTRQKYPTLRKKFIKSQEAQHQEPIRQSHLQEDRFLETESHKEAICQIQILALKNKVKFTLKRERFQLENQEAEHLQVVTGQ